MTIHTEKETILAREYVLTHGFYTLFDTHVLYKMQPWKDGSKASLLVRSRTDTGQNCYILFTIFTASYPWSASHCIQEEHGCTVSEQEVVDGILTSNSDQSFQDYQLIAHDSAAGKILCEAYTHWRALHLFFSPASFLHTRS